MYINLLRKPNNVITLFYCSVYRYHATFLCITEVGEICDKIQNNCCSDNYCLIYVMLF